MAFRLCRFVFWCSILFCALSCGSKKDFVITDDYVNNEKGIKTSGDDKKLSEADRKYLAGKLDVSPAQVNDDKLYFYVKAHYKKRFAQGGASLVSQLYNETYNKKITGTPTDMINDKRLELFKGAESLKEGDLIFFRNNTGQVVTHVGVYLQNNRFISSQYGEAEIYSLEKGTWKKSMVSAGRLKQ